MSKDCRSELVQKFQESLLLKYSSDEVAKIVDDLIIVLDGYDVSETCNALVRYDDENERVIKRYLACLLIDGKSDKTIELYQYTLLKMVNCLQMKVTDIGQYDIRMFLAYEKSRGISNSTLETTRACLSAFFQWMTAEEIIPKNPCSNIKPIKCPNKQRYPFSSVEVDSMRSACKTKRERALIEVLISSGVRVSELTALKLDDIDFARMKLYVRHGKGDKERTTYISEVARTHLSAYLKESDITSGLIFPNRTGGEMTANGLRKILKKLAQRANVENVHPHRFRRTFATGLADRGMPVQEIMRLLGHTNINTTMEYVYMNDEKVQISYKQYIA